MTSSSSAIVATLEPISHDNEDLNYGFSKRHALSIRRDSPLVLGRNLTTGIQYPNISKSAATIKWKDGQVWLERHSSHCSVIQKDGSVVPLSGPLEDGDVVRLYKQEYAYRVKLCGSTGNTSDTVLKETSEECMCSVCMEILVHATAVVPCGHVFCKDCLSMKECPNCRLHIQRELSIKSMDNVIAKLVLSGSVFSQQDVQHYWTRVTPPTTLAISAPVCIYYVYSVVKELHLIIYIHFHPLHHVVSAQEGTPDQCGRRVGRLDGAASGGDCR